MNSRKYFIIFIALGAIIPCFTKKIDHKHIKPISKSSSPLKKQLEKEDSKGVYSPSDLLKEQYEVKNKYNKLCSEFQLSDEAQWPISEIETSEFAQRVFSFNLKDPRDIYDIAFNKKEIDTSYWTQLATKVQPWILLGLFCLLGQCMCCCQIFCIPELKIFRRCCQVDFNKETDSRCEKNLYFTLILLFGGFIFFFAGSVFMNLDLSISANQLQCTVLWTQNVILGAGANTKQSISFSGSTDSQFMLQEKEEDEEEESGELMDQQQEIFQSNNFNDNESSIDVFSQKDEEPPEPSIPEGPTEDGEEKPRNKKNQTFWSANYGGVDKIKQQYLELNDFFQNVDDLQSPNEIKQMDIQPFYDEFNSVSEQIPSFYQKHKGQQLRDPNFLEKHLINSEFIQSIGPIETIGTIGWALLKEINIRKYKIAFIEGTKNHTTNLLSMGDTIATEADEALTKVDKLSYTANEELKKVDSYIDQYSPNLQIASEIIENYYKVALLIVVLGLFGFILVAWPRLNGCAILLHLSWYCSTCVLLVGFILCFGVFGVGLILNNGVCKAADSFINEQGFLQKEKIEIDDKLNEGLNHCLYNQKEDIFGAQKYMNEIQILGKNIDSLKNLELTKQSLNSKINYVQNVLVGENTAAFEISHSATSILNSWSDYSSENSLQSSTGGCQVTRDQWIWSDLDCSYSTIIESTQPDFDLGFTVCLRIQKTSSSFIKSRYTEKEFESCKPQVSEEVSNRFEAIQLYRNSVKQVFSGILNDLNNYNEGVDKLDINIDKASQKVKKLEKEFVRMFKAVTLENDGLQKTLDCSFLKDSLVRAKNAVCITGMNGVFLYAIFFFATSILLIFFSLIVCLSTARVLPNKDEEILKQLIFTSQQNSSFYQSQIKQNAPEDVQQNDAMYASKRRYSNQYNYNNNNNNRVSYNNNSMQESNVYQLNPPAAPSKNYKRNQTNNIFSDQENPNGFKELDASFIKQTQDQIRNMPQDDLDSSFHSAKNHF